MHGPTVGEKYVIEVHEIPDQEQWSGHFVLSTDCGFNVSFSADPIEETLNLLTPCCASMIVVNEGPAHCFACKGSVPYGEDIVAIRSSLIAYSTSERQLLHLWAEAFHPFGAFYLAEPLWEAVRGARLWAMRLWVGPPEGTVEEVKALFAETDLGSGTL